MRELIHAFRSSRAHRDGLQLVLAGDDRSVYGREMHALVHKIALDSSVRFTGPVPDDALLAWYGRARAVALPSFIEGFGLPVVEAMAAGVPCVASDLAPIREVAAGAALLTPPGDVHALRQAIDRACFDDPLRQDLLARGRDRAPYFSLKRMGEAALALYQDVLAS